MKLENKKELAAKTLGVGKGRIVFNTSRLEEIKEAITKQDIRDLNASGAIFIKPINGRAKIVKRKSRRRFGSIKKSRKPGKAEYMILTRKLRAHLAELKKRGRITQEKFLKLRKEIKAKAFRDKAHMKESLA